jgi:AAT family amino acid transporter/GABA permease
LLAAAAGLTTVTASILSPEGIFPFLINACGTTVLIIYLLVCLAHIRLRRKLEREAPERIRLRMWLFPWLSYLTIAAMLTVLVAMALIPELSAQFYLSLLSLGVALGAYGLLARHRSRQKAGATTVVSFSDRMPDGADRSIIS